MKRIFVHLENFLYKVIIKNLLKLSKLGYGFVVTGAEAGTNFEHIYDNKPKGFFLIGGQIDKALLNLPSVQATRARKDDVKSIIWNEIENNKITNKKTRILDLASGGARYLRELSEEHKNAWVESICIDKDLNCIKLGEKLSAQDGIKNIKFFKGDIFNLDRLKKFASRINWYPNVVIASGLFIYFNNQAVEKMLKEIYDLLPKGGKIVFTSYENLKSRKLMRKTMAVSSGDEWVLYYRKPVYWRQALRDIGFEEIFVTRDKWAMNNVCTARK